MKIILLTALWLIALSPYSLWAMASKANATSAVSSSKNSNLPAANMTLWVGKSDAGTSCGTEKTISLDAMAKELLNAGVKVFSQKKIKETKMRIQMCGADKGDKNGFLILKSDLEKARKKDFLPILDIE